MSFKHFAILNILILAIFFHSVWGGIRKNELGEEEMTTEVNEPWAGISGDEPPVEIRCSKSEFDTQIFYPQLSAVLNDKCNYTFYEKYGRPYQITKLKGQNTTVNLSAFAYENCRYNAWNLTCNSEGSNGLRQPLHCDAVTNICQCLVIKEIGVNTKQPMGTSGCLAVEGSFCDDSRALPCGFGFTCVGNTCKSLSSSLHKASCNLMPLCAMITIFQYIFIH